MLTTTKAHKCAKKERYFCSFGFKKRGATQGFFITARTEGAEKKTPQDQYRIFKNEIVKTD